MERGGHRRRQLAVLQPSMTSKVGEAGDQGETGQHIQAGVGEEAEVSCTYSGRARHDSTGGPNDNQIRTPIPCSRQGLAHARYMLERVERLARHRSRACPPSFLSGRSQAPTSLLPAESPPPPEIEAVHHPLNFYRMASVSGFPFTQRRGLPDTSGRGERGDQGLPRQRDSPESPGQGPSPPR